MIFGGDRFDKVNNWFEKRGFQPLYEYEYSLREWLHDFPPGKWWLFYRFHPKHRYHIVDLKLKPRYYEQDTRIFYAIFRIFEEHVEEAVHRIQGYDYVTGNNPDFDAYVQNKIEEDSRTWYLKNRKVYEDFYQAWHWWLKIGKDFEAYQRKLCYDEEKGKWNGKLEEKLEREADTMILKVIRHRRCLWC